MVKRRFVGFALFATCLFGVHGVDGQNLDAEEHLERFLSRLSNSDVMLSTETKFSGGGLPDRQETGLFRMRGDSGVSSKIRNATEIRWIWNRDYVALLEKKEGGTVWTIERVSAADTDAYRRTLTSATPAGIFLGGGVSKRIEFLEPVSSNKQSDHWLLEYRYSADCPVFSPDPVLNSLSILFDGSSEESRLLRVELWDAPEMESNITFEYPNDSLFPLRRVSNGTSTTGEIPNVKIESTVKVDAENSFDQSECYLSHYGLPEPEHARKGFNPIWMLWIAAIVLGVGAFIWNRTSRSR